MVKTCKNSIILIDKPVGITSFDVIKKLRNYTGIKKIGHAGVLDKPASGLLICATKRAAKLLSLFEDGYKIYRVEIIFGVKTDTYDISGNIVKTEENKEITREMIEDVIKNFTGEIEQKAPPYSNVKVNGKRLYKYAAKGDDVESPVRKVTIYDIKIDSVKSKSAVLEIKCSKGTYIRSLANDIGDKLEVLGCVKSLRRVFSYPFDVKNAYDIDNFKCLRVEDAFSFLPALRVSGETYFKIINGFEFCRLFNCDAIKKGLYRVFEGSIFVALIEKRENNKVIYKFILPGGSDFD